MLTKVKTKIAFIAITIGMTLMFTYFYTKENSLATILTKNMTAFNVKR